ncbi:transglutaminase domain-containing protein [Ferrimicrobium acidiphilum]|uniref:transglutaminase family protein n=1 Tax=Ferrimicrobium acidiphilum TaxID=121039 RepID=UPI0023F570E0|nr:transglutaminase domain-containing protein [Ferrimicrobium acidiphilum]
MNRSLLLGLWATALLWPFVHSAGYVDASFLALTPLLLELAEHWTHWILRIIHWAIVLYLQLCLAWGYWVSPRAIEVAFGTVSHQLTLLPPNRWSHISAHVGTPLILVVSLLGWLLFRACQSYGRVLALMVAGVVLICVAHTLWDLPAELPLASFLIVGLIIMIIAHHGEFGVTSRDVTRRTVVNMVAAIAVLVPLVVGFELPARPPFDIGGFLAGHLTSFGAGSATTGYGAGITEVDHSLVPSQAPVFVVHIDAPYYWQAATYNTFNGLGWSNKGPSSTFEQLAGGSDVPILSPYFEGNHDFHVSAAISDVGPHPLTNLFYTGSPLKFSVTSTVHTRSGRIEVQGVRSYTVSALEPLYNLASLKRLANGVVPRNLRVDLELPSNLSPRVKQLAKRLASGTSGPFNVAMLIKQYLDTHYRYSYQVGTTTHNIVNEFLFVDRQGYCDQFSTSFIMMMRSLGIPARWVVGYDAGTYIKSRDGYLIRQVDAHSWAQIWINGAGWVSIDPTPGFNFPGYSAASLSSGPRPISTTPTPSAPKLTIAPTPSPPLNADAHLRKIPTPRSPKRIHQGASSSLNEFDVAIIALTAIGLLLWRWRRRTPGENETVKQWAHVQRVSRRSFGAHWRLNSPREWGQSWTSHFPNDSALIWPLVRLFETSFYSSEQLTPDEAAEAKLIWRTLKARARRRRRSMRS